MRSTHVTSPGRPKYGLLTIPATLFTTTVTDSSAHAEAGRVLDYNVEFSFVNSSSKRLIVSAEIDAKNSARCSVRA